MISTTRKSILTLALYFGASLALSAPALSDAGKKGHSHGHSDSGDTAYGKPGDAKRKSRIIEIMMKEGEGMSFSPSKITLKKGEQIRFKVKNAGELDHEFVIATLAENLKHAKVMARFPNMEHADPNAIRLKPKASGEILWHFTKSGKFDMSCLIPGHREAGMTGTITVE